MGLMGLTRLMGRVSAAARTSQQNQPFLSGLPTQQKEFAARHGKLASWPAPAKIRQL
jgi:hypothetical protein